MPPGRTHAKMVKQWAFSNLWTRQASHSLRGDRLACIGDRFKCLREIFHDGMRALHCGEANFVHTPVNPSAFANNGFPPKAPFVHDAAPAADGGFR